MPSTILYSPSAVVTVVLSQVAPVCGGVVEGSQSRSVAGSSGAAGSPGVSPSRTSIGACAVLNAPVEVSSSAAGGGGMSTVGV